MLIIWLTLSWIFLSSAQKVYVPYNCCVNYFKYDLVDDGSVYMGIFTPPSGSNSLYKWSATFDIHGHSAIFLSPLMPYPNNKSNDQRGQVIVYFVNINSELPMLTHLSLNEHTLCNVTGYGSPSTKITVKYEMNLSRS
uniref:Uncharacterized protein, isoform A n=2 Tax=Drosophila melanogaster TaxID=7227 RepID=A0A0B4K6V3_DROME|nr:uncharacterized protein Dmel_CG43291, isoform A [Drosophila melanogaster]NP_001303506.1 uncharacterized protein Dmel_CG43291, isoform C [Drosophila melanogaster]AFH06411.1 uncharacterized protein Dmel_CG43291, isoform A [Drosophila melanogaster]ALI30569.1 uncharacterized protein Dmel_CG43291, isoform C [Drosophila melanogaster]|eukprot:NP_001247093.1 uncharacterized protein Dmel_CG43291, isoform A [Drosophila melanogaster]